MHDVITGPYGVQASTSISDYKTDRMVSKWGNGMNVEEAILLSCGQPE